MGWIGLSGEKSRIGIRGICDLTMKENNLAESSFETPKELTLQDVLQILEEKQFQDLQGVVESDEIEFKHSPYQLENDLQKLELAKDVAALANLKGGIIVIGVETAKNPSISCDQAVKVIPFPRPSLDMEKQYRDILQTWIFPSPKINIKLYPEEESSPAKVLLSIHILLQKENRPFLYNRPINENGKRREIVFGYAERHGSNNEPMKINELHRLINRGIFANDMVNSKFDVILDKISSLSFSGSEQNKADQVITQHIEDSLAALDRKDKPAILLGAFPSGEISIPTLFQSRDGKIVHLLNNPPALRNLGFDLRVGSFPSIQEGRVLRSVAPRYKVLDLWKDGSLIFGGAGDGNFLCWGNANETKLTINPLALIESTYLFIRLSREVFQNFAIPCPTKATFVLSLRSPDQGNIQKGYDEKKYELLAGYWGNLCTAPGSSEEFRLECSLEEYDFYTDEEGSARIAFELLGKLYTWFGIPEDSIPYTEDKEKGKRISKSMIISGGSKPSFPPPIQ